MSHIVSSIIAANDYFDELEAPYYRGLIKIASTPTNLSTVINLMDALNFESQLNKIKSVLVFRPDEKLVQLFSITN